MTRQSYQQALQVLKKSIIDMADQALSHISSGIKAFQENDLELAKIIIKKDDEIDAFEEDIAKQALKIIWKEQPIAQDLRLVTAILKIITDIERIGDHASDISEITLHLEGHQFDRDLSLIISMANQAQIMVHEAISSLLKEDPVAAKLVIEKDDQMDVSYRKLIDLVAIWLKDHVDDAPYVISILLIGKYLERVADHAVNIAEWVIFLTTGQHKNTLLF